jgi:hypothetical protein
VEANPLISFVFPLFFLCLSFLTTSLISYYILHVFLCFSFVLPCLQHVLTLIMLSSIIFTGYILRALSSTSPRLGLGPLPMMRGSGANGGILIHHNNQLRSNTSSSARLNPHHTSGLTKTVRPRCLQIHLRGRRMLQMELNRPSWLFTSTMLSHDITINLGNLSLEGRVTSRGWVLSDHMSSS